MRKFSDLPLLFKVILALIGVGILGVVHSNGLETRLTTLNAALGGERTTVVAGGDLDAQVPDHDRLDEVGAMARALGTFKDSMLTTRRLEERQHRETADQLAHAEKVSAAISAFQRQLESMLGDLAAADELRGTSEITRSAQSAAVGTTDVAANMASLRHGTEDTVSAAVKVRSSAERLKRHFDAMQQAVDDFVCNLRRI